MNPDAGQGLMRRISARRISLVCIAFNFSAHSLRCVLGPSEVHMLAEVLIILIRT